MGELSGKSAIVTGSTRGIGLALARSLAAAGADIMINGLGSAGEIEETQSALMDEFPVRVIFDGANMAVPEEIVRMAEVARAQFGSIDILINNAGIQHVAPVEEFPLRKWDEIIAVNMSSAFHAIRAVLPSMKSRGWGRIINLASAHGLVASPFKSAYVAAKHGVVGLTKTVALETAQSGITCNAICPGYVRTPLVEAQIPATARVRGISEEQVINEVMLANQPTGKFVRLEEIGTFAAFLCTDNAASITGAALQIDGGWTAR